MALGWTPGSQRGMLDMSQAVRKQGALHTAIKY